MNSLNRKIFFVMGVSGSGKSTIGSLLAKELSIPFFDGDDFHSPESIDKMTAGIPLTDEDRKEWLLALNKVSQQEQEKMGCVIACSALKVKYREILNIGIEHSQWVFLKGSFEQISKRLDNRKNHFMSSKLLKSQFEILEEPVDSLSIDIDLSTQKILKIIRKNVE